MKWKVRLWRGRWAVFAPGNDTANEDWPTLAEAHTAATQLSIATELFQRGGVTRFYAMKGTL